MLTLERGLKFGLLLEERLESRLNLVEGLCGKGPVPSVRVKPRRMKGDAGTHARTRAQRPWSAGMKTLWTEDL
jgi:hypothetical protein